MIKRFGEFNESTHHENGAAGIAIVLKTVAEPMILLVHATNSSWQKPRLGIPKGRIEDGESIIDAAIRETYEETGIKVSPQMLEPGIETAEVWNGSKFAYNIHYLVLRINDPSDIGLDSIRVPKSQLQIEEVDWAGFIGLGEAYEKISSSQRIILDRVR
jgi:8-oxo-dGTP pyrophosphatase MutT (NUDIX family)